MHKLVFEDEVRDLGENYWGALRPTPHWLGRGHFSCFSNPEKEVPNATQYLFMLSWLALTLGRIYLIQHLSSPELVFCQYSIFDPILLFYMFLSLPKVSHCVDNIVHQSCTFSISSYSPMAAFLVCSPSWVLKVKNHASLINKCPQGLSLQETWKYMFVCIRVVKGWVIFLWRSYWLVFRYHSQRCSGTMWY